MLAANQPLVSPLGPAGIFLSLPGTSRNFTAIWLPVHVGPWTIRSVNNVHADYRTGLNSLLTPSLYVKVPCLLGY